MMLEKKTWKDFRESGLLWWTNRILHTFGWAITVEVDETGKIINCYPARCKFRGFSEESETRGFKRITEHLKESIDDLVTDTQED